MKGVFGALSSAATAFGEDDLATSIDEYATILAKMVSATRDFAEAAISVAKAIEKLDEVTFDQILLGAGIGFNVAIIAVAIRLSGLLGKSKPPTQVILEQLQEIRKQIVALRDEMRVRFDRIEKRLNKMYLGLLDQLAEMDFDLGQIEGNVDELQVALYDLHAELQRLATDVHAFLEAANRRDLIEAINGSLGFRDRTGEDLSLEEFRAAENQFFSWGNDHAKDVLQAGPDARDFGDSEIFAEVTALPLATNVNYLREFPAERLGLPPLSAVRMANPFDWIVAGEAYAQLHEESPARTVSADRVAALVGVGEALGANLSKIVDSDAIFAGLAEHYLGSLATLQAAIAAFEAEFRARRGCPVARDRPLRRRRSGPGAAPAGRRLRRTAALRRPGVRRLPRHRPGPAEHRELRLLGPEAADDRQQPRRVEDRRGRHRAVGADLVCVGALGRPGVQHGAGT